jgi:cytochrome c biogenesis protein
MAKQKPVQPSEITLAESVIWLWRFFSSVRLALGLILLIAALSLLDAFTNAEIIGSVFFAVPAIMLLVNILICTLNRWKSLKAALHGGQIIQPESFFETGAVIGGIKLPNTQAAGAIEEILINHGYRVRKSTGDGIYIAADKNRYFRLGTVLTHFSLILFVGAFLWGAWFGFQETGFQVTEGQTAEVGHDTGLSLKLISFVYEQYDNGMPKDYRSQVVLYKNGQPVQEALIRVNHPLNYKGVRFYQSFFGTSAASLIVNDEKGEAVFEGNIPVTPVPEQPGYLQGYQELPEQGLTVIVMASNLPDDAMVPAGYLVIGLIKDEKQIGPELAPPDTPVVLGGYEFTFQKMVNYSGFQVSRDPANAFIWISSILFIIGLCAVFYFTHRQVWVLCREDGTGTTLFIQIHNKPGLNTASDLNNLEKEIRAKLPSSTGNA